MSILTYLSGFILVLVSIGSVSSHLDEIFPFFRPIISSHHEASCAADDKESWSYRGSQNGPSQWGRLFPEDCSGKSQSPIDIDTESTEEKEIEPLGFINYDVPISKATMVNNGHTVQIMPEDNVRRVILVNGEEYELAQFHFHWGLTANKGSEHTLDGKSYAMEIHFVHLSSDSRVAVVGVFFKQSGKNDELQTIVNSLSDVSYKGTRTSLKRGLTLSNLLPKRKNFYRYDGSLTTPNCTEGVVWSVMPEHIRVGQSQMKEFRRLFSVTREEASEGENEDCLIAPNYRPVQPLNGRPVLYSG